TVKLQLPALPAASVAEQLTVVVPFGKAVPEAGLHVTAPKPGQLSEALVVNETTAEHWPGSVFTAMFAGQVSTGGSLSVTVTVKLQLPALSAASVAEQLTVVDPFGKAVPEAGLHVTAPRPGQLSEALVVN